MKLITQDTLRLFNALDNARFYVTLTYLKRQEHLLPQVTPDRAQVWCADFGRGWDFYCLLRLSKWFSTFEPVVIVCVNSYPLFYDHLARIVARSRFPIVPAFHSAKLGRNDDPKMRVIYHCFLVTNDRIIYISAAPRAPWQSRGIWDDRGAHIHNGLDVECFRGRYTKEEKAERRAQYVFSPTHFVVGICAESRLEKQDVDSLPATSRLNKGGVISAKCRIIGDGPCRTQVEETIRGSRVTPDTAITGFQEDVRPLMTACACLGIVSSPVEAFSLAALEAMAMVMSAIGGGASEQNVNGYNGYLYFRRGVNALADSVIRLTDASSCDRICSRDANGFCDLFSAASMLGNYETLLAATAQSIP